MAHSEFMQWKRNQPPISTYIRYTTYTSTPHKELVNGYYFVNPCWLQTLCVIILTVKNVAPCVTNYTQKSIFSANTDVSSFFLIPVGIP